MPVFRTVLTSGLAKKLVAEYQRPWGTDQETKLQQAISALVAERNRRGLNHIPMSTTTSFTLPDELRSYIDERVRSSQYDDAREHVRDLIRRDREEQGKKRLRELIEAGLESGAGRVLTPKVVAELKKRE